MDYEGITKLIDVKRISQEIIKTPEDMEKIRELNCLLGQIQGKLLQNIHHIIICSFYPIFKKAADNKNNIKQDLKVSVVETLTTLFGKIRVERIEVFLNIYGFLLNEIYDPKVKNCVAHVNEEYKLIIVNCVSALTRCLTWEVTTNLYTKEHAPKLCQLIYVVVEIAKTEQFKKLRFAAIRCLMTIARIEDCDISEGDVVLQAQVADVFVFFLPGISSGLRDIALEDEKIGHAVVVESIKAFGRLVRLIMKDPNHPGEQIQINFEININKSDDTNNDQQLPKKKWKSEKEINDYLQSMKRDEKWFKDTDSKLQLIIKALRKLTHHSHPRVREELSSICKGFIQDCSNTMCLSICYITEILIILSEDEYKSVSETANEALETLSKKFLSNSNKKVEENLEEKFYEMITDLPRIFNSFDEQQQLSAINMLIGYLRLFNKNKLVHILYSQAHLQRLILALINITKMETNEITQLEDYVQDAFADEISNTHFIPSFKKFKYIQNHKIALKVSKACSLLAHEDVLDIVSDSLITIIQNNDDEMKEAVHILNEVLSGIKDKTRLDVFENVIVTYLDPEFWDLPLHTVDNDGNKYSLGEVQNNILQVCLLVEGFGKIASYLGPNIQQFLLKIMYPVLERAGSPQSLVRRVGLESLKKLATACGHNTITDLINANSDYFSYHVIRKIQNVENNENVLNVLCVVIDHSSIDVLPSISDIIEGILVQTCDKYFQEQKAKHYLYVFKTFIKSLMKWLDIKPVLVTIKPKTDSTEEKEDFRVTGLEDINNFSDDLMEKTAEEMFKEDMAKSKKELLEENEESSEDEYKKSEPPTHVKLTVLLLKRCLHFLPAKDRNTKLLALEILKNGLEIIRDWEDELLPMVHQIWSPLVNRFNVEEESVVVNYSFQLLATLARLSRWFIRSRTVKEALPNILTTLDKLNKESYLKDKGSSYRYTQSYKLQLTLLEGLPRLVIDSEMIEKDIKKIIFSVLPYLSDKQPLPLRELSVTFFKDLIIYDNRLIRKVITKILEEGRLSKPEFSKNVDIIKTLL